MRAVLLFYVIGFVVGPILSFALIFTALPLVWIDLIGSLLFARLVPCTALCETLLYFDLKYCRRCDDGLHRLGAQLVGCLGLTSGELSSEVGAPPMAS
jgi:hypothetical protein